MHWEGIIRHYGRFFTSVPEEAVVTLRASGGRTLRFERKGAFWLGLVCGLTLDLARVDAAS